MTRPTDNYQEFVAQSYKTVDTLLSNHYPTDMDIETYEGVLVDSFIGYAPKWLDPSNYDLERITKKTTSHTPFNWIVVLGTFVNEHTSHQHIIYTNDEYWVDSVREQLNICNG